MVLPLFFLLFLLQSDTMPPGYSTGTKITIVADEGSSYESEVTFYLQPDRSRTEYRYKDGKPLKDAFASVVRCDLRLSFSPDSPTYDARPYPPPRITEAGARALRLRTTPNYRTVEPTQRIETNYKDTGERREFFGLIGRHIIITTRQNPFDGRSLPRTEVRDGWYISVPLTSCEQQHAIEAKDDPVIYPNETIEYIETVTTGDVPDPTVGWLPAEERQFARQTMPLPDGTTKEVLSGGHEQHIKNIEDVPMDPALFGPPAFYGTVPLAGQR
jgi:hypothetical protein